MMLILLIYYVLTISYQPIQLAINLSNLKNIENTKVLHHTLV